MATLDNIKTRLGIALADTSQDARLNLYIADAQAAFLEYTGQAEVPAAAGSLIEHITLVVKARQESGFKQGESIGDYSATNYVLGDDMPKSVRDRLNRYRKVTFL